jgi:hypothetical protein
LQANIFPLMKRAVVEKKLAVIMFVIVMIVFAFAQHDTDAIEKKYFNSEASSVSAEIPGQHSPEEQGTNLVSLLSPQN